MIVTTHNTVSRVVLGTAQLGMDYGIANVGGRPSMDAAAEVVRLAWEHGVRCFDTAQSYGESELVLGSALFRCGSEAPKIVTKLNPETDINDVTAVVFGMRASLERLHIDHVWGLMLHDEGALDLWIRGGGHGLQVLKQMGLAKHLGVSVYSVERALQALAFDEVDIIQVPANIFDRRMVRAGVFSRARELGKTVFVRSVFLQGLVFLSPGIAARVPEGENAVRTLSAFCEHYGVGIRKFVLDHICWAAPEAQLVIGAETAGQIQENCNLLVAHPCDPLLHEQWDQLWAVDHSGLIDPRSWPKKS